ncbi:MAG: ABC transporter substrate-binding protein [Hyphomicrobiaceae bacterium]
MIGRRALMTAIAVAALARPGTAQTRKAPLVGVLDWSGASSERVRTFIDALHSLGPVHGQRVALDVRNADGRADLASRHAAELVAARPDVIVGFATPAGSALKRATTTIPLVLATADPVGAGLVSDTARPTGNATGVSSLLVDIGAKHIELLCDLVPRTKSIAFIGSKPDPATPRFVAEAGRGAERAGRQLVPILITGPDQLESAFAEVSARKLDAAVVQPLFALSDRAGGRVAGVALRHRVPAITGFAYFARHGGLAAYGSEPGFGSKAAARNAHRILLGAKPGDLPVEQPTRFLLVINLKTAKTLGVTIPPSILVRADEVIE